MKRRFVAVLLFSALTLGVVLAGAAVGSSGTRSSAGPRGLRFYSPASCQPGRTAP